MLSNGTFLVLLDDGDSSRGRQSRIPWVSGLQMDFQWRELVSDCQDREASGAYLIPQAILA